jgi:hypothetical protein
MAGFECASHRRSDGSRVDILAETAHTGLAVSDYRLLHQVGITTVREGLRWHLIERERGRRDWSSFYALAEAAELTSTEVIWDLLHFGFPDWVNPFHPDFPKIFADFAADFAARNKSGSIYTPVNEISFHAWAAGEVEYMYPYSKGRGRDLKHALCAASIAAITVIRAIDQRALIMAVDPMIAVHPDMTCQDVQAARILHEAQFEAMDILFGRHHPEFGGSPDMVDIVGLNHYPHSQWIAGQGPMDWQGDKWIRPAKLIQKICRKYGKPILLSETGCEGDDRPGWFDHISSECMKAAAAGVPVMGICLYPILSHHAWTGERHCPNGLFDGTSSAREIFMPLLHAIRRFQSGGHETMRQRA